MNKYERAKQEIEKGINIAVEEAIKNAPITIIENGRIVSNGTDDGYNVEINKVVYDNILVLNRLEMSVNDSVKVVIPNGNYNNMFILGKI